MRNLPVEALLAAFAVIACFCGAGFAQAEEATGDWHGSLNMPGGVELRIGVSLKHKANGGYEGVLLSPDQTSQPIPLDEVTIEGGQLNFAIKAASLSYSGRWDDARKAWVGEVKQGATIPLILTHGKPDRLPVIAGLDGDWAGAIMPAGATVRLILHVHTDADGTVVRMDSPDQLAYGIPLRSFKRAEQQITFDVNGSSFEGQLSADMQRIEGLWTGRAYKGPLTFTWEPRATSGPKRPQTPQPPFHYRTEDVVVDSAPGVKLAGTLTLPQGRGPFPAAVMITGSGAQDRDETILGHKPFAVIADRLTRDGIAVLRVDDRGFAKSTGDFASATDDDFAIDAAANVAFLRRRPDIDPNRIGLIGHSEGGLVAPKVAAKDPKLAFIVMMAGPGVPLSAVIRAQRAALLPAMGFSSDRIGKLQTLMNHVDVAIRGANDEADAKSRALRVIQAEGGDAGITPVEGQVLASQLSSTWMRDLAEYDPAPTLAKVKCPILVLNGSKDRQVLPDQNLPAIRAATKGNSDVTVIELPGLNHLFQTAKTGAVGEYADIEETIAPIALDTMSAWIRKHVAK